MPKMQWELIRTVLEEIAAVEISHRYATRVNLMSIVRFAARRKGIARLAVLHLDCARSAKKQARIDSRGLLHSLIIRIFSTLPESQ